MAIINCPECGNENVSDKATSCPKCGFGIKAYYEELAEKKRIEEAWAEAEKEIEEKLEAEEKEYYESQRRDVEIPAPPSTSIIGGSDICWFWFVALFLLGTFIVGGGIGFISFVLACITAGFGARELSKNKKKREGEESKYSEYINMGDAAYIDMKVNSKPKFDREEHRKRLHEKYEEQINLLPMETSVYTENNVVNDMNMLERRRNAEDMVNKANARMLGYLTGVKCPNCGSFETKKIDVMRRTASIALWGLASDKIGKQYKCCKCNHLW